MVQYLTQAFAACKGVAAAKNDASDDLGRAGASVTALNTVYVLKDQLRQILADVMEIDPGLTPFSVGQAIARGLDRPIVSAIELRRLIPVGEDEVRTLLRHCIAECAAQSAGTAPPSGG